MRIMESELGEENDQIDGTENLRTSSIPVSKVDSLQSAPTKSRHSQKVESLMSVETNTFLRCTIFPCIDYVAGIAASCLQFLTILMCWLNICTFYQLCKQERSAFGRNQSSRSTLCAKWFGDVVQPFNVLALFFCSVSHATMLRLNLTKRKTRISGNSEGGMRATTVSFFVLCNPYCSCAWFVLHRSY